MGQVDKIDTLTNWDIQKNVFRSVNDKQQKWHFGARYGSFPTGQELISLNF